jgi:hypothetical protein
MNKSILVAILLISFESCEKRDSLSVPFNNLSFFLSNVKLAGFIIETDSFRAEHFGRYRVIELYDVLAENYARLEITIQPEIDSTTKWQNCTGFMLPVLKDPRGLELYNEPARPESGLKDISTWHDFFSKDSMLYKINMWSIDYGRLHWFAGHFRSALFSQNKKNLDSILTKLQIDHELYFIYSEVQSKLRNYKMGTYSKKNASYNCYKGKIILSPLDTLTPQDSADFRNCVIKFRQEHGLASSFMIDSSLLTILKIPIHPIEEGLKKYWSEKTNQ